MLAMLEWAGHGRLHWSRGDGDVHRTFLILTQNEASTGDINVQVGG